MSDLWSRNLCTRSDSYKFTHHLQLPPGTEYIYSYFESRVANEEVCFFGLQEILKKHLVGQVVTREGIEYACGRVNRHLGREVFNRAGWEYILNEHGGRLPIRVRAVPEGMVVPSGNVLMTVENTDPGIPGSGLAFLTNFLETLLMQVWYPTSVATLSRNFKKMLDKWGRMTGAPPDWIDFALHDFGFRGVSSVESAGIGGLAHLVNFRGTDTFEALEDGRDYYGEDLAGFSIPAAEHSTIISWGEEHEVDAYRHILEQFPDGNVALPSDSYDIANACRLWGSVLKEDVLGRKGTVVIRPDSGTPWEVVLEVLNILWDGFDGSVNAKGYRVLDPHVRVIQGDGVALESADKVMEVAVGAGYAAENLSFGMGGGLLQKLHRDWLEFAFKACWRQINGVGAGIAKNPKHMASKASKPGRKALVLRDGVFATVPEGSQSELPDILEDILVDGDLVREWDFPGIRLRAAI